MRLGMNSLICSGLLLVSFIALGLTAFINLHKFDRAFDETVNDRFYFILEEVRNVVEGEMRLGQPISQLKTATSALNAAKEIDPYILSVEIFNNDSKTLYSTDNSFLFDLVPDSWEKSRKDSINERWKLVEDNTDNEAIVLGLEVKDALLQSTGSIVLRYSSDLHSSTLNHVRSKLIETALIFWAFAAIAVFIIVFYLTKPLKKYFGLMEEAFNLSNRSHNGNLQNETHIAGFISGYQTAEETLNTLETELHKMDEFEK